MLKLAKRSCRLGGGGRALGRFTEKQLRNMSGIVSD